MLISQPHYDHLDLPSLRGLDATALVIVPRGLASMVRRAGLSRVVEVEVRRQAPAYREHVVSTLRRASDNARCGSEKE